MDCVFSWLYCGRKTSSWSSEDDTCYDIIANLPLELSTHILRQLDARSLAAATLVNRKWLRIIRSDRVLRRRLREAKRSYWRSVAQKGWIEPSKLPIHLRANFAIFAPPVAAVPPQAPSAFQPYVIQSQPAVISSSHVSSRRKNSIGPVKSALKTTAKKINNVLGKRPRCLRC